MRYFCVFKFYANQQFSSFSNCSNNIVEYVDAKSFNQIDELKIM